MKIVIVGTGYVGLVTGACLADVGMQVTCVDVDKTKIENLKKGILPIYEPGLEDIVHRNFESGRLDFSTSLKDSLPGSQVVFIAVGTPPGEDGSADLQYVKAVATEIGQHMNDYLVVVTKSTVPVGTSHIVKSCVQDELNKRNLALEFDVASNPEFLKEGAAIKDFMSPDRVIIGVENERAKKILEKIYKPFLLNGFRVIYMSITSAEMTKYAANAMLATRISFMNDIANLCDKVGANINDIRAGIGADPRIGKKFLYAGVGYGGSCFPKDVKALAKTAKDLGHSLQILDAVEDVNNRQKLVLAEKILKHFGNDLSGKTIALWGLAFKPNTDDMREAPAIYIAEELLKHGAKIKAIDPVATHEAKKVLGDRISYHKNVYETTEGADAIALVTEWNEFRFPDWDKILTQLKNPVIFDGRNIYERDFMEDKGFIYYGIGV
ncbi:UDP-glucose dehydrogenase family protein [Ornithobacterium rhinotracheale]|uniref:UDP-glucose 6-dehydrogenase n=1 Tax=Ornithobacterium rhinotracheale (strain ATCC 51463 / DSM 15997 / CCUG 23171 / CIP 104009 / LMG 9086) TaxID=867902 RepID=I3ZZE7_ORNRL|nr:UDP-glucose/GDP-mannose dehydrogenase family protein [Ornithobacterium rhinotracheale]AFL97081.1 nucleotide sugar dehydrogenase [Ornithobacterium rhinotracheale DSM 15997]AIP99196.1 UDP-glucose 6-dehydrogenase [Ornithobacterium rhinotracheale ORT-UMN 88]KGB67064.1 UDP-glucose 6-dehydrogenase [Ornithobacterium rhinotracheale H06-030791]MBN3662287.1 UDP-glucose/GDP-mannose dehydrogenase family protein [Ornithobacterium rhinotracheale]MCK0194400.1 UDP-glucose/GDP-mannose dehydrogenase family p